jgi:hypothetical protein
MPVEDLGNKSLRLMRVEGCAFKSRDPRALLPTVLESVEGIIQLK